MTSHVGVVIDPGIEGLEELDTVISLSEPAFLVLGRVAGDVGRHAEEASAPLHGPLRVDH